MLERFEGYFPETHEVETENSLQAVVSRLSEFLPDDFIWKHFSSHPNATGGKVKFPYCRVDSELICCQSWLATFSEFQLSDEERAKHQKEASISAFSAVVWIEVGFQGLDNLARSRASVNWTSAVGHFVDDEERYEGIMTKGKEWYEQVIGEYIEARNQWSDYEDYFSQYGLDFLLDRYQRINKDED